MAEDCVPKEEDDKELEGDEEQDAEREDQDNEDDTLFEELFTTIVMAKEGDRYISDMFKVLPSRKV